MDKSQRKGGLFIDLENTDGLPLIHESGGGGGGGAGATYMRALYDDDVILILQQKVLFHNDMFLSVFDTGLLLKNRRELCLCVHI